MRDRTDVRSFGQNGFDDAAFGQPPGCRYGHRSDAGDSAELAFCYSAASPRVVANVHMNNRAWPRRRRIRQRDQRIRVVRFASLDGSGSASLIAKDSGSRRDHGHNPCARVLCQPGV